MEGKKWIRKRIKKIKVSFEREETKSYLTLIVVKIKIIWMREGGRDEERAG